MNRENDTQVEKTPCPDWLDIDDPPPLVFTASGMPKRRLNYSYKFKYKIWYDLKDNLPH